MASCLSTQETQKTNLNTSTEIQNKMIPINAASSFANILKLQTREEAIILNAIHDLEFFDYIEAIGQIVQPENIVDASKISNERICIYLKNKTLVNQLIARHPIIKIKNHNVAIRKLINPAKKLIISGVQPIISKINLQNKLESLKIKITSQITDIRIVAPNPKYQHIKSFKKMVFIEPDDEVNVPSSTTIEAEGETYRIFFQIDDNKCYKCKKIGHAAAQCPSDMQITMRGQNAQNIRPTNPINDATSTSQIPLPPTDLITQAPTSLTETLESNNTQNLPQISSNEMEISENKDRTQKRRISSDTSDESSPDTPINNTPLINPPLEDTQIEHLPTNKPKANIATDPKKIKIDGQINEPLENNAPEDSNKDLEILQPVMEADPALQVISYETLKQFIDANKVSNKSELIVTPYTNDLDGLVHLLETLHPTLTSPVMKRKFSHLIKKLTEKILHTQVLTSPDNSDNEESESPKGNSDTNLNQRN